MLSLHPARGSDVVSPPSSGQWIFERKRTAQAAASARAPGHSPPAAKSLSTLVVAGPPSQPQIPLNGPANRKTQRSE